MTKTWQQMEHEMRMLMAKHYKADPNKKYDLEEESDEEYKERIAEEKSYMRDKL